MLAGRRLAAAFQPAVEGRASIFKKSPFQKKSENFALQNPYKG